MISIVKPPPNPTSATVDEVQDQNKATHVWRGLNKHKIKLLYQMMIGYEGIQVQILHYKTIELKMLLPIFL
jgi:hypothetical protein